MCTAHPTCHDTSGNMIYDGHYVFDYDPENRLNKVKRFEQGPEAMALACDTTLTFTMGGDADWFTQTQEHYFEGDAAQSGDIGDSQYSSMEATVSGTGYISFYWKVSNDGSGDYLRFYIDDQLKEEHGGVAGWSQSTKYYVSTGGSHTLKWVYIKNSTGSGESDCAWVDKILWEVPVPMGVDKGVDSLLSYTSGGNSTWSYVASGYYGGDSAKSGYVSDEEETWMQTTVEGAGTFKFWWKVSSESGSDYLEFYIDDQLQAGRISGSTSWAEKSYTLGAGAHTLRWRYVKDSSGDAGEDCGWVDHVQWSEPIAEPPTDAWSTLTYTYDAAGRRIEKRYDDTLVLKYIYDGDHCIAEYDASNNLRRKYIFGPIVDEPICMIENAESNAPYYYHFDALGSVIALTDESGDAVQVYEYDVYGRVGASDANHPNRFMFTGREFDKETGLYYYRARYYNAEIGRFLQTDPIGYGAGMNLYAYCGNGPVSWIDPSGLLRIAFFDGSDDGEGDGFNGTALKEMTDDKHFDLQIDISMYKDLGYESAESYILKTLEYMQYAKVDVTEIYLFDHGAEDDGMQLGDTFYSLAGPSDQYPQDQSLQKFAEKLGSFLKHDDPSTPDYDGAVINLRCCFGGTFADEVATWSGVRTTGWTQEITGDADMKKGKNMETSDILGGGPDRPDYGGTGRYKTYTPRADGGKADLTGDDPPCSWGGYCGY